MRYEKQRIVRICVSRNKCGPPRIHRADLGTNSMQEAIFRALAVPMHITLIGNSVDFRCGCCRSYCHRENRQRLLLVTAWGSLHPLECMRRRRGHSVTHARRSSSRLQIWGQMVNSSQQLSMSKHIGHVLRLSQWRNSCHFVKQRMETVRLPMSLLARSWSP